MADSRVPDLTIENRRGDYVLTLITPLGMRWLDIQAEAHGWTWEAGAVIVRGLPDAWPIVNAALDAGLRLGEAHEPTVRPARTVDGEWLH
jgi:hypothetical protein